MPLHRIAPPFREAPQPAHPAWRWLGATFAAVTLGGLMLLEALTS